MSTPQKGTQKVTAQGTGLPGLALRRREANSHAARTQTVPPVAPDAAPSSRPNPLGGSLDPKTAALVKRTLRNTQTRAVQGHLLFEARRAELILKQVKFREFCEWINRYEVLLSLLSGPYNQEIYQYIYSLDPNKEAILERIKRLKDPQQKQLAMTAAQRLRQEERQEGERNRALHIARNMLFQLHLDLTIVAQTTGLSQEELQQLEER